MGMLRPLVALLAVLLIGGCDLLGADPSLEMVFDSIQPAVPPDSLADLDGAEWANYPPIVSVYGGDGRVVVEGDYTWGCANGDFAGTARFVDGNVHVTVGFDSEINCQTSTPKLQYWATVSPLPRGPARVVVFYDIWARSHFGDIGPGITKVHRDTVQVD